MPAGNRPSQTQTRPCAPARPGIFLPQSRNPFAGLQAQGIRTLVVLPYKFCGFRILTCIWGHKIKLRAPCFFSSQNRTPDLQTTLHYEGAMNKARLHVDRKALIVALSTFILLRFITSLAALVPNVTDSPSGCSSIPCAYRVLTGLAARGEWAKLLISPWYQWDTVHYMTIAEMGYEGREIETVWPPVYPLLIRAAALIFHPPLLAALIVSNLAALITFYLLYVAVSRRWGEHIAIRTSIAMATFPTGFFLLAGYSESLFLALSLGSLLAAGAFSPPPADTGQSDEATAVRNGPLPQAKPHWGLAGLLAALATLTRLQGVFLALPLLWQGCTIWRRGPNHADRRETIPPLLGASLAPLAFCAYAAAVHFGLGYDWPWATLSKNWIQFTAPPWMGLITSWRALTGSLVAHGFNPIALGFDLALAVFAIVLLIWGARDLPVALSLFGWSLLLSSVMKVQQPGVFVSVSRYVLSIFPMFIVLAHKLRSRELFAAWTLTSVACESLLASAFTSGFWVA